MLSMNKHVHWTWRGGGAMGAIEVIKKGIIYFSTTRIEPKKTVKLSPIFVLFRQFISTVKNNV